MTRIPVERDISKDGICETSPSPIVSRPNFCMASFASSPWNITPFLQPVLTEACKYSNIYSQSDNNSISRTLQTSQKQFGSILTDYDIVFRNYLANELFSDLISPEAASTKKIIEHMIIKMQWIMIEYTAIRQSLFLWYSHNANIPLTYETIREHIVIISRMTGYDDDDIREYLENSFAKLIWDWGYAALIMGIRK